MVFKIGLKNNYYDSAYKHVRMMKTPESLYSRGIFKIGTELIPITPPGVQRILFAPLLTQYVQLLLGKRSSCK